MLPADTHTATGRDANSSGSNGKVPVSQRLAEIGSVLDAVGPGDRNLDGRLGYRGLLQIVASRVNATYCRLVTVCANESLNVKATAGPRPPRHNREGSHVGLAVIGPGLEALATGRSVVIKFDPSDPAGRMDRDSLFTPLARTGLIVPFHSRSRLTGLLVIGEERQSRGEQPSGERLEVLEFIAKRLGEMLEKEQHAKARRLGKRRRERRRVLRAERARLARELHDAVGQSLNALLVQIRVAAARGTAGLADLRLLEMTTRQALDGARTLAYQLRRPAHDWLQEARLQSERILADAGCLLAWTDEQSEVPLGRRTSRELAAAINESISNIARHARAGAAEVRLEWTGRTIRVTIRDDGIGFVPQTVTLTSDGRGLGLLGMVERMEGVGGSLRVQSVPGTGTTVVLEAPPATTEGRSRSQGVPALPPS